MPSAPLRVAAGHAAVSRGPLLVRLCNWVGEVVLSLPALERLDAAGYELQLYGRGWARPLLEGTGWRVLTRASSSAAAIGQLRRWHQARPTRAPAPALLLTKSFSSALETRLAGLRPVGYARDGRRWLLRSAYPLPRFAHAAEAYWHLAGRFLGEELPGPPLPELTPSTTQRAAAAALLAAHGLEPRGYVLLCPFSGADDRERRKVWPGFAALAALLAAHGVTLVVCPGPGEEAAAATAAPQALRLTGVDLGVYGALLAAARCVVANDTGPGHLAAAVGARLVSVYGRQSVAAWAPLGRRVELLHDPAGWPSAETVAARVLG